jgi:uncharacterized membrane protein YfcA
MLVTLVFFAAIFVQAGAGFGMALIAMPLLAALLGVQTAAPLVAVVGPLAGVVILMRYRQALALRAVVLFTAAALGGVPLGLLFLVRVDEAVVTVALGVFLVIYSMYALLVPRLPQLTHRAWAVGLGLLGGVLSGAYNTGGPPIIVYGTCRRWKPATFKSNLQGYFLVIGLMTLSGHALAGNLTPVVWQNVFYALPGAALGLVAGFSLDGRVDPGRFRQIVFVLLAGLGISLILGR